MADRYSNCDELFDDDGEPVCDGDEVTVNGSYIGRVRVTEGKFTIEGWPENEIIHSLTVLASAQT